MAEFSKYLCHYTTRHYNKGNIVLDLGFTTKAQREIFIDKAKLLGVSAEVHYLDTPIDVRRQRVKKRNTEKDPSVYSVEVTEQMFEFMEPRFEIPQKNELLNGRIIEFTGNG